MTIKRSAARRIKLIGGSHDGSVRIVARDCVALICPIDARTAEVYRPTKPPTQVGDIEQWGCNVEVRP